MTRKSTPISASTARSMPALALPAPTTNADTRPMPMTSAVAVAAIRRGLRTALATASSAVAPSSRRTGQPSTRTSAGTSTAGGAGQLAVGGGHPVDGPHPVDQGGRQGRLPGVHGEVGVPVEGAGAVVGGGPHAVGEDQRAGDEGDAQEDGQRGEQQTQPVGAYLAQGQAEHRVTAPRPAWRRWI
ncbi:hypothetical protein [Micromonospora sp. IBHARD004]|uniref:hypothetical protein n=1 Tax=Micromonospora sp. IBHARD004 TaxID=3457764 RepID=UPI00405A2B7E